MVIYKRKGDSILKKLELNMDINQLTKKDGVPFEVVNPKPSKELLEALEEEEEILKDLKSGKRKGYTNMNDLIKSLNEN